MAPYASYIVLALGIVIGAGSVGVVLVWRKALAERSRERYFSDVRGLASTGVRRAEKSAGVGMPRNQYHSGNASRYRSGEGGAS